MRWKQSSEDSAIEYVYTVNKGTKTRSLTENFNVSIGRVDSNLEGDSATQKSTREL